MADCQAWAGRALTPAEVASIKDPAMALDNAEHDTISKYLQHCTTLRYENDRSWDVEAMTAQVAPIIASFEKAFPR